MPFVRPRIVAVFVSVAGIANGRAVAQTAPASSRATTSRAATSTAAVSRASTAAADAFVTGRLVTMAVPSLPLVEGLRQLSAASGNPTFIDWNGSKALDLLEQDGLGRKSLPAPLAEVLDWPCPPGRYSARELGPSAAMVDPDYLGAKGKRAIGYLGNVRDLGAKPVWIEAAQEPYWEVLRRAALIAGLEFQPGSAPVRSRYVAVRRAGGDRPYQDAVCGPLYLRLTRSRQPAALEVWVEPGIPQSGVLLRTLVGGERQLDNQLPDKSSDGRFVFDLAGAGRLPTSRPATAEVTLIVPTQVAARELEPKGQWPICTVIGSDATRLVKVPPASTRSNPEAVVLMTADPPGSIGFEALLAMDEWSVELAGPQTQAAGKAAAGLLPPHTALSWQTNGDRALVRRYLFPQADWRETAKVVLHVPVTVVYKTFTAAFEAE